MLCGSLTPPTLNPIPIPIQTGIIISIPLTPEQITEHAPQIGNVGLSLKLETTAVCKVFRELRRTLLTQRGNRNGLFLLHNELVLLGGTLGLESLPGQLPLEEVHEDIPNGFQIVTAGLFHPQVIVDGGVTGSSREGSPLALGDVLERTGMAVALRQSEINAVNKVVRSTAVGDKVGRLDVPMDQMATVHNLHALQHLIGDHESGLEAETASALVELVLERWPKKVHDHEIVRILDTKVMDLGEAGGILKLAVDLVFVTELGTTRSVLFEFNGHFFAVGADAKVDVTEGTTADAFRDAVFGNGGLHCDFIYFWVAGVDEMKLRY